MVKVQGLPIIKVKVQYSNFKAKLPTCIRMIINYLMLRSNLTHFTM